MKRFGSLEAGLYFERVDVQPSSRALVVFTATYVVTGCLSRWSMDAAKRERTKRAFKATSPGTLPPLGIILACSWRSRLTGVELFRAAVSRAATALRARQEVR